MSSFIVLPSFLPEVRIDGNLNPYFIRAFQAFDNPGFITIWTGSFHREFSQIMFACHHIFSSRDPSCIPCVIPCDGIQNATWLEDTFDDPNLNHLFMEIPFSKLAFKQVIFQVRIFKVCLWSALLETTQGKEHPKQERIIAHRSMLVRSGEFEFPSHEWFESFPWLRFLDGAVFHQSIMQPVLSTIAK
jgi:hypothetical protein